MARKKPAQKTDAKTQEKQSKNTGDAVQEKQDNKEIVSEFSNITADDPRLNPNNPEYDADLCARYAKHLQLLNSKLLESYKPYIDKAQEAAAPRINEVVEIAATAGKLMQGIQPILDSMNSTLSAYFNSDQFRKFQESAHTLAELVEESRQEWEVLQPYIVEELKDPKYKGVTLDDLLTNPDNFEYDAILEEVTAAARTKAEAAATVTAQNNGRELRRRLKANAEQRGAIMEIRGGILPVFSERDLWDAFAPGKISRLGSLSRDEIDKETGRISKPDLENGDIVPLHAADISYKAFMLLNAIIANSVGNFREEFMSDGAIEFYVKGVLDALEVDPRIRNDMQLDLDRKTAGVLYLEKKLEPLLSFVGTTPRGSRYAVLSYDGYNVNSDTMTIRTPYLYQLWKATQHHFAERKQAKEQRIAEGKKPNKKDLRPLEVNMLFKNAAYKEDDAVLEIATYITNVMLNAGKGSHKTEIAYITLINNCPRLKERLTEIDKHPKAEKLENGKIRNNTARYNTELRKIARAYNLIMDKDKCDALRCFNFSEFSPSKEIKGKRQFIAPTKSTIKEKITIKWRRIAE